MIGYFEIIESLIALLSFSIVFHFFFDIFLAFVPEAKDVDRVEVVNIDELNIRK